MFDIIMSSMSWHAISCPTMAYSLTHIIRLISCKVLSSECKPIYKELMRYDEILLFRPCNRTSGCWCNRPSSSTLRMASNILADDDKVRKSRRFSWVAPALTAKKTQVCRSTVYKNAARWSASISFCSWNSRLISGVMTITPLFSLWCRISWWSKPYRSPANQEHMMALTSPNSWNPGGGGWCNVLYIVLFVKKGFTHFICIHMPSTRRPNSNVCPRNPSQRQRSELLKAASANATKFQWPKCLCPCRGSCYTIRQKNASCKNHSSTGNQKITTICKAD